MDEELIIIDLPNGDKVEVDTLATFDVADRQYIAVTPIRYLDTEQEIIHKEIIIYRLGATEGEDTILEGIESTEEYDLAANALAQLIAEAEAQEAQEE